MAFKKGQSGNPGGRPKENPELKELARSHTTEAVERLAYWMRSDDATASVKASTTLLERAWGKPEAKTEVEMVHRYVARVPNKAANPDTWQKQHAPKPLTH